MDAMNQIIPGRHGAPALTLGELALKFEAGHIQKNDLELYYGVTAKQIFEFIKSKKEASEPKVVKDDYPGWPYEEGKYGSEGCAG